MIAAELNKADDDHREGYLSYSTRNEESSSYDHVIGRCAQQGKINDQKSPKSTVRLKISHLLFLGKLQLIN